MWQWFLMLIIKCHLVIDILNTSSGLVDDKSDNIGSGDGLVLSGIRPLPYQMLTKTHDDI